MQDYRVDERERQRRCRERRREAAREATAVGEEGLVDGAPTTHAPAGGGPGGRHAPASTCKTLEIKGEVRRIVDSALDLSRASLERALPRAVRVWVAGAGTTIPP